MRGKASWDKRTRGRDDGESDEGGEDEGIVLIAIHCAVHKHCYGDVSSPLKESVELVESIVREQTYCLVCRLADICNVKETVNISQDEFLYLFRHNQVKLQRLLSHLKSKDLKQSISKEMDPNPADIGKGRRFKSAEQYIETFDVAGSLSDALEGNLADVAKDRRLLRQDLMSRAMNEDQYMKFHESRQVNLGKRLKSPKMRDWLFGDIEKQYKMSPVILELIAYCMHETVAELVDLAIMMKVESTQSTDPLDRLKPFKNTVNPDWLTQRRMLTTDLSALKLISSLNDSHNPNHISNSLVSDNALTPSDIREAIRRRAERVDLLRPQVHQRSQSGPDLLCL